MPKRISIMPDLTVDELEQHYRQATEPLANKAFNHIDDVEKVVIHRCRQLLKQKELLKGLTFYHWFNPT